MDGVEAAFSDLEPVLLETRPAGGRADRGRARRAARRRRRRPAGRRGRSRRRSSRRRQRPRARGIERIVPGGVERRRATKPTTNSSTSRLDQLEAAAGAGRYQEAEQARLAAYGFFEFGPELKLRAFDPQLALEIEGLIWYGAHGDEGLANLVADDAPLRDIRETRLDLDEKLDDARAITGDGASADDGDHQLGPDRLPRGPRGDPDHRRDHRQHDRPAGTAAAADLPRRPAGDPGQHRSCSCSRSCCSTRSPNTARSSRRWSAWSRSGCCLLVHELVLPPRLLDRVDQGPPRPRQGADRAALGAGAGAATVAGLYTLGFTSVFREGFETVLFLQALQLSSGTGVVLAGVSLGLVADRRSSAPSPSRSSASCPTRRC